MTDYRRLTEEHINDAEFCSGCGFDDDLNGCEIGGCDKYYMYFETYERLKKLEDMIESGELVNANDIKSENAALRERLEDVKEVEYQVKVLKRALRMTVSKIEYLQFQISTRQECPISIPDIEDEDCEPYVRRAEDELFAEERKGD